MNAKGNPYDFIKRGNYSSGTGGYRYFTGTFKDAIDLSVDGAAGSPFRNIKRSNVQYQNGNKRLKIVHGTFAESGYFSLTMSPGWEALFYVKTANNDFYEDNVLNDYVSGDWNDSDSFGNEVGEAQDQLADAGYPTVWVQDNAEYSDSRAIFGLDGSNDDYFSFDLESNSSNVGQTRVRLDGIQFFSNKEPDNDVWITPIWIRQWVQDLTFATRPTQGAMEEGGTGDLDGDGIMDKDDPNPNLPEGANITDDPTGTSCPVGFVDNGFGVCIPDPTYTPPPPPAPPKPEDDVSAAGIVALLVGIAGVVYLAVSA